ncbi:MAG TPA: vitamin K epoxide reductase family protein [Pseudoxanthomonas sp.]|nr:vitamin K epoxide reductase family protein [Pseudoxanthomonas sp.]
MASKKRTAPGRRSRNTDPVKAPIAPAPVAPDWPLAALAGFGLLLTGYLTLVAWTRTKVAFCTAGSGCDLIQDSEWSTLLGLPMSLWGFGLYALIGALALQRRTTVMRRWRHAWRLSLLGLAISVYLTAVGVATLDAVCLWCLLSLATLAAIFAWLQRRRPSAAPGTRWSSWLLANGLVTLGLVGALHVHQSGLLLQRPEDPRMAALVGHLNQAGAKMYGASWCANCREQRRLFGVSARRLQYVECSPSGQGGPAAFECVSAGIEAYPTWVIDGLQHRQLMQPQELAAITGFDWSGYAAD